MKDKIERFSKGDFEYELPFIYLSVEELRITVECGKVYEGNFTISNSSNRIMKGVCYSSNRLLVLKEQHLQDAVNTVHYSFDASYLKAGESLQGEISIVSDCGEKQLLFFVQVEEAYAMTTLGKIKDLFQFTNLARADWSEAKKVFRQEDFEHIFLAKEERYRYLYRNLIKSSATSQALEEFLIAIHKKAMIRLKIDKTRLEYDVKKEEISDHLTLSKDHWGYAEIRVSTDAPFIKLEQKRLWADRFVGNSYMVAYTIDPNSMRAGNNFGHIWIKTMYQTLMVEVVCKLRSGRQKTTAKRLKQKLEFGLMDNYLSFRLNKMNLEQYVTEAEALLQELPNQNNSRLTELIKTHLAIISGKTEMAKELLEDLGTVESGMKHRPAIEYGAYLYLKALYDKKEETIKSSAETIRNIYENQDNNWRLLWFLLNLDSSYKKNKTNKLKDIREQFQTGCHSPILYYEAVCVFNEEPVLLRELGEFELQVLNYGINNWILTKELALQFTYLAGKVKSFHPIIFKDLTKLYDEYGDMDILTAICCTLIKGIKKSEKYFEWYRLGVVAQLRITELYEYYIYCADANMQEPLEQTVLLYFIYNSNLSDKKKAYLYANIVKNKDKLDTIYRTYYKRMEVFASKMLEAHLISKDLAVLYKEFINKAPLNSELFAHLPYVLYRHELICDNSNMISVTVIHKELGLEEHHTLEQGKAQIDLYTGNAEIFLIDSAGNRYVESVDYKVTPFLNAEEYENHCLESQNTMLLLHLFDRCQNYRIMSESSIELRKQVLEMKDLAQEYVTCCYQALIEYYYENYNDELLEYYLNQIDLHSLKPTDRTKYLEYMVTRSLYEKAIDALRVFGFEGIPVNRLLKMCSGWLIADQGNSAGEPERVSAEEQIPELIVELCFYIFTHGKYDEAILRFLMKYYEGSTKELYLLWKAAKSFELDTHMLEERLLTQMLFSESYLEESCRVFSDYYKEVNSHTLVRAFLSFYAYKYLVHQHVIHPDLFAIMKRELNYEENEICLLAWLKHNTLNKKLTESEVDFIRDHINRLVKKGIILPFYAEYHKQITLPEEGKNRCYISYITDPGKQVYIHYRLLKQETSDYITERMDNAFMGIHVKDFMLFYHETVQYYITEQTAEGTNITESLHTQYECETLEDEEGKYNCINMILMAMEVKDDNTLLEMMENYTITEGIINTCFGQIE